MKEMWGKDALVASVVAEVRGVREVWGRSGEV